MLNVKYNINMLKKVLCFLSFLILVVLSFCGCTFLTENNLSIISKSFYTHSVLQTSGNQTVTETFMVNLKFIPGIEPSVKEDLAVDMLAFFQSKQNELQNEYDLKFEEETNPAIKIFAQQWSSLVKREEDNIFIKNTFQNNNVWKYFTAQNNTNESERIYRFWDYINIDRKEKVGTLTQLGGTLNFFGDFLKTETFNKIVSDYPTIEIEELEVGSSYCYITPYHRRHSNADNLGIFQGYYYHQWNTENETFIEFYTIHARAEIWYSLALGTTFLTIGIIFLTNHFLIKKNKFKIIK